FFLFRRVSAFDAIIINLLVSKQCHHTNILKKIIKKFSSLNKKIISKVIHSLMHYPQIFVFSPLQAIMEVLLTMNTLEKIWKDTLTEIELEISRPNFNTWFKKTFPVKMEDATFYLGVPNEFNK